MKSIRQRFAVNFEYEVIFTHGLFDEDNRIFSGLFPQTGHNLPVRVMVFIDDGVDQCHPNLRTAVRRYFGEHADVLELRGEPMVFPGGEKSKNTTRWLEKVLQSVNDFALDRHSYVAAIGGGAFLDTIGFACSIAHRGVRLIRIPTTVLSQNDSGLGVKNGINFFNKKNFIGSFTPPFAVINDFDFLHTLDIRDWRSGIAEAIKVGLIKEAGLFSFIETNATQLINRDMKTMQAVIYECAKLHLNHISSGDAFELGSSRPLDFGHWSAHKLEQMTDYKLRHGEAVAIGIALDTTYSHLAGMLDEASWKRVLNLMSKLELEMYMPEMASQKGDKLILFEGLEEFREHLGGELTIMLLNGIGKGVEVNSINDELMEKSVSLLAQTQQEATLKNSGGGS